MTSKVDPLNLKRETLVDKIFDIIEKRILTGKLKARDKLSEIMLAKEFNVSRGPTREALLRLEEMGLVEKSYSGREVKGFNADEFCENYELKLVVEAYCCMQGAYKATEREISKIKNIFHEVEKYLDPKYSKKRGALNNQFHESLVNCSQNKKLIEVYKSQTKQVHWGRFFTSDEPLRPEKSFKDHQKILNAFIKKDGEKVRTLVENHRKGVMEIISKKLQIRSQND
jgi:DNA-binding GntR family transcriptional regulator